MPETKPTPQAELSDQLLLAALERAERHQCREGEGVLLITLKDHLGLPHHSGSTRRLQPRLDRLQASGLIERVRQHCLTLWKLTNSGHARLKRTRRTGELALPESPQHRKWATAQLIASERIADLEADLWGTLEEASTMLDEVRTTSSEAWYELIPKLNDACWRLAAAVYILGEWAEPTDEQPDIDTHPQRDRRNIHTWEE